MAFRGDSKVDAFHRQISALRQQLGAEEQESATRVRAEIREASVDYDDYGDERSEPDSPPSRRERTVARREADEPDRLSPYAFRAPVPRQEQAPVAAPGPEPAPAVSLPAVDAQTTVVAVDTVWRGELETDGSIHVYGRAAGSISARQDIFVAEEADVEATVAAGNVIVAGMIRGTVRCSARCEVLPQGRVLADVHAPTLVVHEGATVKGQVQMGPLEIDTKAGPAPAPLVQRRVAHGGD